MTSPPVSESTRPRTAEGVAASLLLANGSRVTGELLTLDSAIVMVLSPQGIVAVRHDAVETAEFPGYPRIHRSGAGYLTFRSTLDRLKLDSRYPYGIPAPALAAIMGARQQTRVDTIRPAVAP